MNFAGRTSSVRITVVITSVFTVAIAASAIGKSSSIPHFQTTGAATQLIVDGKPFLILGGELGNSTASSEESLQSVWPTLEALHLNTVLAPVYWEQLEPTEGKFDYTLVDSPIDQARAHHFKLVLLWFGVWKNSMSTYVPAWVKQDEKRFPRAEDQEGNRLDILSPFSQVTLETDETAFASLMRHLREKDSSRHTVLMVQAENEIGMLPKACDYSDLAKSAMNDAVPSQLLDQIKTSNPVDSAAAALWRQHGSPTSGNWTEVFGSDDAGAEVFMAWHYAQFIEALVKAGKAEYPLPMYVNVALNFPGKKPGQYPAGGAVPHLLDVWRAGARDLDAISPDVYFLDFGDWTAKYLAVGRPLFVPETMRTERAAANALFLIGAQNAIGFSPFAIESVPDWPNELLGQTYGLLGQLMPEIAQAQSEGNIYGLLPHVRADGTVDFSSQTIHIGDYILTVTFDGPSPAFPTTQPIADPAMRGRGLPTSGGLLYVTGPGEYTVIGTGVKIRHSADTEKVGLLSVDEWTCRNGRWSHYRWLNGDQTNQGREVHLYPGDLKMQRVKLYQF